MDPGPGPEPFKSPPAWPESGPQGPGVSWVFHRACRRQGPRIGRPRWGTTSATLLVPKTPSNEPLSGDAPLCAKIGIIVVRSVSTVPNIWGFVVFSGPHQIDPKSQIPLSPRPIKNTPGCLVRNPLEELLAAAVFVPIGRRYVGCYVRLPQSGVTRFCFGAGPLELRAQNLR